MSVELRTETGGPRFYIDGEPLHAGDSVVVDLGPRPYLGGPPEPSKPVAFRFEWAFRLDDDVSLYAPNNACVRVAPRDFEKWLLEWPEDSVQRRRQERH